MIIPEREALVLHKRLLHTLFLCHWHVGSHTINVAELQIPNRYPIDLDILLALDRVWICIYNLLRLTRLELAVIELKQADWILKFAGDGSLSVPCRVEPVFFDLRTSICNLSLFVWWIILRLVRHRAPEAIEIFVLSVALEPAGWCLAVSYLKIFAWGLDRCISVVLFVFGY